MCRTWRRHGTPEGPQGEEAQGVLVAALLLLLLLLLLHLHICLHRRLLQRRLLVLYWLLLLQRPLHGRCWLLLRSRRLEGDDRAAGQGQGDGPVGGLLGRDVDFHSALLHGEHLRLLRL